MDNSVDEIKKKLDIVDFIGARISLKKMGRNFKAVCPFHQEKTPSFVVSPERQIWHCFGSCQDGGDVIKFLMKYENITFIEALRDLAQKTGVKLQRVDFEDQAWKLREKLFSINQMALNFYKFLLEKHKVGAHAREYLKNRDINEKLAANFELGYAPSSWDSLLKFLKSKEFDVNDLVQVGLIIKSDKGSFYDRFRSRIIFPLKDTRGNVVGFSGRLLSDSQREAKYVNTPETPIYHKREALFGIDKTKDAIVKEKKAIIVEGEFDMLSLFQHGFQNVVAVKGSAVTRDQLTLLSRFTKGLILALDVDAAGTETTKRAIEDAEVLDFNLEVASFDFAKDPDEAVRKDPVAFKKIIAKPLPVYDYIIKTALDRHGVNDAFSKKQIGDDVIPFFANIQNPIVKSYYIKELSKTVDVEPESIEKLLNSYKRGQKLKQGPAFEVTPPERKSRSEVLEQYILGCIFQSEAPFDKWVLVSKNLEVDDIQSIPYQKILETFIVFKKTNKTFDPTKFSQTLAAELKKSFDELYLFDSAIFDETLVDVDFERSVLELKRLSLKTQIKKESENTDEKETNLHINKLLVNLAAVEKKLAVM